MTVLPQLKRENVSNNLLNTLCSIPEKKFLMFTRYFMNNGFIHVAIFKENVNITLLEICLTLYVRSVCRQGSSKITKKMVLFSANVTLL